MSEILIEEQLLNASELFHYAYRFKDSTFVISIPSEAEFEQLMPDLSVLRHAGIKTIIITNYTSNLNNKLKKLYQAEGCFCPLLLEKKEDLSRIMSEVLSTLDKEHMPIILSQIENPILKVVHQQNIAQIALAVTRLVKANKLFFCGKIPGLVINQIFYSAPTLEDLEEALQENKETNLEKADLSFILQTLKREDFDLVLVKSETGSLFQEIFTHLGAGTIVSKNNSLSCRSANLKDVPDICLLLKPAIRAGSVISISESDVIDQINNFYVYISNDLIVATACLKDYGEALEISKVCTFPRYQGKGLARGLVRELFLKAKQQNSKYIFGLSVSPRMWHLFEDLGFREVEKTNLPAEWQQNYDFSRPSKAFWRSL